MVITWIFFIIEGLISFFLIQNFEIKILPFIVIISMTITFIIDLGRNKLPKKMLLILFVVYFTRVLLLFFDLYGRNLFVLPNSGFDSERFHGEAIHILQAKDFSEGSYYSGLIAIIYNFFGIERIISQYVNVLLSMNAILLTYKTLSLYNINKKITENATIIMALLPNYALLSSILLRESMIIFSVSISIYNFSLWLKKEKRWLLFLSVLWALVASVFHSGSVAILMSYAVFYILYDRNTKKLILNTKSILYAVLVTAVFSAVYINLGDVVFTQFTQFESLSDIMNNTSARVDGGSAYSVGIVSGNPVLDFLVNTPIRMVYYLITPLPWQWRGLGDVLAFVFSALFYGYTLYISIKELGKSKVENKSLIILFVFAAIFSAFVFSWGVSNYGTALRHRDKFIGVFIILLALVKNSSYKRFEASINIKENVEVYNDKAINKYRGSHI